MLLGEKISSLRKSRGISQELLAENSRISLRTVQRIESGQSIPRPYTLKIIANALEVPVEYFSSTPEEQDTSEIAALRAINLSALVGLLLPPVNIILPLIFWRRRETSQLIDTVSRRIISFQILWTVGTFLILVLYRFIQLGLTGSVQVGHFPAIFFMYAILIAVNCVFILKAAVRLHKQPSLTYSFIPSLF
ncbi:MAG: helix-turn-helix domain-containing protein [Flammeovirgaceae bacterium]|nr:helix-turn-helix domain-containing protein [Flammeovirgaceae bacterium]